MTDILPKLDSSWSKPMNDVSELVRWLRDNWGTLPKHSQIADTLERLAAENELLQANGENAHRLYCAILRERDRLREELVEANQMLRSCYSVTERRCAETNWEAFDKRLAELLERQRVRINEWGGYRQAIQEPKP